MPEHKIENYIGNTLTGGARKNAIDFSTITACGERCVGCKKKEEGLREGCIEIDGHCKE